MRNLPNLIKVNVFSQHKKSTFSSKMMEMTSENTFMFDGNFKQNMMRFLNLADSAVLFSDFFEHNMAWVDKCTFAALNIILTEIIWRYGIKFKDWPKYLLLTVLIAVAVQYNIKTIFEGIIEQLYLVPIWWIIHYAELNKSAFDYADWIRSDCGLDYATGMAANYFHGYLKLILSSKDEQKGIAERIENYESRHGVQFAIKRLIILVPESLHTMPVIESKYMQREHRQPLEGVRKDRAGVSRPYLNDVYRIEIDNRFYYISVEGATPLLSYFDALNFDLTTTWQMKAMQKEINLKFFRYLKKILEKWPETRGQCELIYYNDYTSDGEKQDLGEVLRTRIKQIWEKEGMLNNQTTIS